jgi:RNA polymerase sigma-70 factor (ECF subfamily)
MGSTLVGDPRDIVFERLYSRYVRDVYRYVLAVLRNPAEAEDVTQTTFLNAYRALCAGENPRRPRHWLLTIAQNACRSRIRYTSRRPREVPLDEAGVLLTAQEPERPNVREVLRALGRLPFKQRAALAMREIEGRSYSEIADTLDVTVPAVEALIARARRTLRMQAAALRGLAVALLPRSLRRAFEEPDVTFGGVLGAGAAAKAATALVAAGVLVGGVASSGSQRPSAAPPAHATPRVDLVADSVAAAPGDGRHPTRHARPAAARHRPAARPVRVHASTPPVQSHAPVAAAGAAGGAPAEHASSGSSPAASARQTADQATQTVASTVASVPVPAPQLPVDAPTPVPTVPTVPSVPSAPPVPTVPSPPSPPPPPPLPPIP